LQGKVLIVEDQEELLEIAMLRFRQWGFEPFGARGLSEALEVFEQHNDIRLLFSDICLPEEPDGYKLADFVTSKYPACKVILTSGHGDVLSDRSRPILRKPYEANDLLQSVKLVLAAA
jgi:DNA-binding NtrC family response regulator